MSPNPIELVLHQGVGIPQRSRGCGKRINVPKRSEAFDLTPDERAAVLTQLDLRDAAETTRQVCPHHDFHRDGLEQATRLEVAALHAARFKTAGITTVADLGAEWASIRLRWLAWI